VPILYTDRVVCRTTHIADQNGELSLRPGSQMGTASFALRVSEGDKTQVCSDLHKAGIDSYVVLSPGGGWRAKCWPAERFGALCRKIQAEIGLRCVINYGPGEDALAEDVRRASGNADPLVYDGELGPLMALLRGAQCIVGGDTGPLHLAIALGTRAVALFGPTDPARNGPYPPGQIVMRSSKAQTTYGRSNITDPSLLDLSVDEVLSAVRQRLGASS